MGGTWIIPARAGFTTAAACVWPTPRDHPRSRGVYLRKHLQGMAQSGSSPLARGLPRSPASCDADRGIIPARAGFTCPSPPNASSSPDHPRSRGVYSASSTAAASGPWIIPARAGFTRSRPNSVARLRDHPRSRGVYAPRTPPRATGSGSSPLARGLPMNRKHLWIPRRIIPARAGFTRSGV